ncbi:MAG: hypothetical protein R3C44_14735 [Chloroflexota bacterium]
MNERSQTILKWTPRILAVLYAAFLSMFAMDVWGMDGTMIERLGGFLIHLTPVYVVVAALLVGWKWPLAGGVLFLLMAVIFTLFFDLTDSWQSLLLIGGPLVVIGALFAWDGRVRHSNPQPSF